jgi:hypothetical protein
MRYFQLCLVVCVAAFASRVPTADANDDASRSGAMLGNPLWAVTLDRLPATRDRPLFSPSRRPPAPPESHQVKVVAAVPTPRGPPSIVLLGVVTDISGAWALVRAGGSDKTMHARIGDEIAGWKVSEIASRGMVLSSEDRSVSFSLFAHAGAKNSAGSAPVAEASVARAQSVAQETIGRRSGRY